MFPSLHSFFFISSHLLTKAEWVWIPGEMGFLRFTKIAIQSLQVGFDCEILLPCFLSLLHILILLFFSLSAFVSINQDAEKLAGEDHAWKAVKDAVNEVRYPKSKEGILSVMGYSPSFSCERSHLVCSSSLEINFLTFTFFLL